MLMTQLKSTGGCCFFAVRQINQNEVFAFKVTAGHESMS